MYGNDQQKLQSLLTTIVYSFLHYYAQLQNFLNACLPS